MAHTYSFRARGFTFPITVGVGFGDGVIVTSSHSGWIGHPEFIEALKEAHAAFPIIRDVYDLEEFGNGYAAKDISVQQLRNYLYGYSDEDLAEWIRIAEVAGMQKFIPVTEYMQRYIEAIQWEIDRRAKKIEKEQRKQERVQTNGTGYVYLIQSPTGAYKIGRTKDPNDRMATFSVKLPFEVEYVCVIQTPDMYSLETDLHNRYAKQRVNGEWFQLNPEDVQYIKGLAS
jgi:hypothetical protein